MWAPPTSDCCWSWRAAARWSRGPPPRHRRSCTGSRHSSSSASAVSSIRVAGRERPGASSPWPRSPAGCWCADCVADRSPGSAGPRCVPGDRGTRRRCSSRSCCGLWRARCRWRSRGRTCRPQLTPHHPAGQPPNVAASGRHGPQSACPLDSPSARSRTVPTGILLWRPQAHRTMSTRRARVCLGQQQSSEGGG